MSKAYISIVVVMSACCLFFLGKMTLGLWSYWRLNESTIADVKEWNVKELGPSECFLSASYSYEVRGRNYQGSSQLDHPLYLNKFAAEADLKKTKTVKQKIWYRANDPSVSAIQKIFPSKSCVYFAMTAALLLYFFFLVTKFLQQEVKEGEVNRP